ncbi:MAG: hypothetical protein HWQ38_34745 [Nostoc sp. NMS7]|nr:hypothetical protein [Nostoc sp. NMS7]MBN3951353.1 hypothetical protein [Nostoc sp. NMS7]
MLYQFAVESNTDLTPNPLRQMLPCGNAKSEQVGGAAQRTGSPTSVGE